METLNSKTFRFADFELDGPRRQLRKQGQPVALNPKTFDLLIALVERHGEVVGKDELLDRVWPGHFVEEGNLTVQVSTLRKIFGESKDEHRFVVTVPGRGYSFVADVTENGDRDLIIERHSLSRIVIDEDINDDLHSNAAAAVAPAPSYFWNRNNVGSVSSRDESPTAILSNDEAATKPFVTATGESAHPTSSAEYVVSQIKAHRAAVIFGLGLLLVGLVGGGWWLSKTSPSTTMTGPFGESKFVLLTSGGRVSGEPIIGGATISPDGKYVAFWTDLGHGKSSIWLRQVLTNSVQRILGPFEGDQTGSLFSRDGQFIYFTSTDKANPQGALFQIPVLGNVPPRRILEGVSSAVTFSPDEKEIAFVRADFTKGESSLLVANADGSGTPRIIATRKFPEYFSDFGPSWSPDGKVIACGAGILLPSIQGSIVEVPARGGAERTISTGKWATVFRVLWLPDGSGLVANAHTTPRAIATHLWHISYPEGNAAEITYDLNGYGRASLGLSADGNTIATVQEDYSRPIFAASLSGDTRQISYGKHEGTVSLDTTPDGKIVYIDPSPDGNDIWIMNGDGSGKIQLTNDQSTKASASVSPDGRFIAFASHRSGGVNIWRMDIDGSNLRQLTEGALDNRPRISPDGKWVVFMSFRSGSDALWKVSIDGGEPVQLSSKRAWGASISPDGKLIACVLPNEATAQTSIGILPFEGGEFVQTLDLPSSASLGAGLAWTPDGRAITYLDFSSGSTKLVSRPLDGGPAKPLANVTTDMGNRVSNFAWSRDGKQIIFSRGPFTIDILLIKDFR